ncbi:hypothetical protein [Polyangium sorediatum]|uniref:Tail assembly chaperone n=1 Tax=Polyangium sorediatum TaxID=889274 RepID=A0ABT6NI29_9BACT|nr:hypothetical protein [Polyangium sorediatum]MDI1427961.1 hypothetical protein [Polyangium sorediatum]
MEHTERSDRTNPTTYEATRDARWAEDFPEGSERRALDERMVSADGRILDEEAETIEDALCLRFGASPEAAALRVKDPKGLRARAVLRILRLEQDVVLTRLVPEDLVAALLDGVPAMESVLPSDLAPMFVSTLRAFFAFADRELGLPHAKEFVEVLDKGMALALTHVLRSSEEFDAWEEDDDEGPLFDPVALLHAIQEFARREAAPRLPTAPARVERNKKKARRRAQKVGRRRNR